MTPHVPAAQKGVELGALAQGRSQPPQCSVEVIVSTQLPPHAVVAPVQPVLHPNPDVASPTHTGVGSAQLTPHEPQLAGSPRPVSHPSAGSALQSAKPGSHTTPQLPIVQTPVAFGGSSAQARVQLPHRMRSDETSASQPLLGMPSQSAKPGSHRTSVHVRVAQLSTAPGRLHSTPQPPQLPSSE